MTTHTGKGVGTSLNRLSRIDSAWRRTVCQKTLAPAELRTRAPCHLYADRGPAHAGGGNRGPAARPRFPARLRQPDAPPGPVPEGRRRLARAPRPADHLHLHQGRLSCPARGRPALAGGIVMSEPAFSSCLAESLSRYIRLRRLFVLTHKSSTTYNGASSTISARRNYALAPRIGAEQRILALTTQHMPASD